MIQDSGCAVEVLYSENLDSVLHVAEPKLTTPGSTVAVVGGFVELLSSGR